MPDFKTFTSHRYDEIVAALTMWGYGIDDRGTESRWNEREGDPPIGLVRVRALRLIDGEPAQDITFKATEFWDPAHIQGPRHEWGFTLVGYAYHGQAGPALNRVRYDYDPEGHPTCASHLHRPGRPNDDRLFTTPVTVTEAIGQFEQYLANRIFAGFQPAMLNTTTMPGAG